MDITVGEIIIFAVVVWFLLQIILGISDAFRIMALKERVAHLKEISDTIHDVKVEKHSGVEYWYDKDTNQFLGQGSNIDEIIRHVRARFPDHIFLIHGQGGVAKHTDWKFLDIEELKKVQFKLKGE